MVSDTSGATAAPAALAKSPVDSNEIGADVMRSVGARFGVKFAEDAPEPPAVAKTDEETETAETPETPETPAAEATEEGAETETPDEGAEETPAEPTADEAEAKATAAETAKLVATTLKSLPEATRKVVQGVIDKRLGQVIAKERAKADSHVARIGELETELAEAKTAAAERPAAAPAGVHPTMLLGSEAELQKRLAQIDAAEEWAIQHEDGYAGDGTDKDPAISAADIKLRWRALARERDRIIPAARQAIKDRAAADAALKATAPGFLDRKTADGQAVQAMLKLHPELAQKTNGTQLAVQLVLGARALAALAKPAAKPAAAPKKAPRVPGAGGPAKGGAAAPSSRPDSSAAMKTLMQRPGDKSAFNSAVEAAIAGL